MKLHLRFAAAAALTALAAAALAQTQGVSDSEIVLGTIQDLSGPLAGYGKAARQGMQMRVNELNEQGGIAGRKLRLIAEDSAYDPKKAVAAAQKLVNQDKVFAVLGHIGTAHNNAAMPIQFEKNVINFMPLTAARQMFDPPHRLKFALLAPYYDGVDAAVTHLVKTQKLKTPCIIYQDDDFGLEILQGAETALKRLSLPLVEKTTYKRGATDFSSQVARMKAANCDLVVTGTVIRETIGTIATARKLDFNPVFVGSTASYTELIHKLGGAAVEGFYTAHTFRHPYVDDATPQIAQWARRYQAAFNEEPNVFSVYGYKIVDLLAQGAARAGKGLTTDAFIKAMEAAPIAGDFFGTPEVRFSAANCIASDEIRLSQIKNGRWTVVVDKMVAGK